VGPSRNEEFTITIFASGVIPRTRTVIRQCRAYSVRLAGVAIDTLDFGTGGSCGLHKILSYPMMYRNECEMRTLSKSGDFNK